MKFHKILLSCFKELALTNYFSSISNFGQISKFKSGIIPRKNIESKFPANIHIYSVSFITTKFHEILLSGYRRVVLTKKIGLTGGWVRNIKLIYIHIKPREASLWDSKILLLSPLR